MPIYDPERDIPDLTGKTIFITGGTGGLGAASALHLAKHNPEHIYISGRNAAAAKAIIQQIHETNSTTSVTFIQCDLASLTSVSQAATTFIAQPQVQKLDILICNAGIMAHTPALTTDGYEIQFGTNHLGHALLIKKFLPLLTASPDPRIVLLTSQGWALHPSGGIIFPDLRTTQSFPFGGPWRRYGQSKLANLIWARELARRVPGLTAVSVHPGVVGTGLFHGLGLKDKLLIYATAWWKFVSVQEGAWNQVWAATVDKKEVVNGGYYEPVGRLKDGRLDGDARDEGLGERLWNWTEEALEGL